MKVDLEKVKAIALEVSADGWIQAPIEVETILALIERIEKLEAANAIAVDALQCFADKYSWPDQIYGGPKENWQGWRDDNIASFAVNEIRNLVGIK